jgi:hypothetical protein
MNHVGTTVEIFRTNIATLDAANLVIRTLSGHLHSCRINIDLHDCDKILRIEGTPCEINTRLVAGIVSELGHEIQLIED